MPDKFLTAIWTMIGLITVSAVGLFAMDVMVWGPREKAWRQRCTDAGGTPVPTSVSSQKGRTQYGNYVCVKVPIIEVK